MAKKRATPMSAKQIRELRISLGMTQDAFGAKLGVSQRQVNAWEAGKREPSGPALKLLHLLKKGQKID